MAELFARRPVKQLTMLVLLMSLLLFLGVGKIHCAIPDNSTDVLALQDFRREITYDPTSVFNSWRSNISHCNWEGVKCSATHPGRVVALELPNLGLGGQISSSVGNLTFLKTLDLSTNSLAGHLPPLNHLQRLQILNLTANSLQDVIPDSLLNCSNLEILDLSSNSISGEIPQRVDLLAKLLRFRLSRNSLTGIIPPRISNITSLNFLALAYNQLTGSIPDGLGKLPNITSLLLGGNSLSGEIPHAIFNQSSLRALGFELNKLVGKAFPPNAGDALPYLWWLTLSANMFDEGGIPDSLGNASALEKLDLSENSFSGRVPTSLGRLSKLSTLSLQYNKLEASDSQGWEFLSALGNCTSLQLFSLLGNQLQGQLPNSVGSLPSGLQQLFLSLNNLSGTVPPSIGNLKSLNTLGLTRNSFSGTIEEWIGNLTQLQGLYLGENNFSGLLPSSIGNLNKMNRLYLQNNRFEGPIPHSLGNLINLANLDLSYNNLQGEIPQEIGNLKQLIWLNVSSNKLTGEIPITIGFLNSMSMLNLSHNNLSGTIPTALSDLPSLSVLDLSYNDLQGVVPVKGVFGNPGNVSLGSNWGLCGGPMSLHLPPCPTVSHRGHRRDRLIKILIPVFGFMSLVLLVYFLLVEKRAARRDHSLSPPFGKTFQKVSYNDLVQATRNFSESNLIGRGSYGSVYRGKLKEPDMEVAVKVFNLEMRGAERSFMSECEALRSIQHRNLLPIITACSTVDTTGNVFKALIYEFMPNGSLDTWLHHRGEQKAQKSLGLTQRLKIAVNIADALDYVHHDCGRTTVHCDLKPSNILLDDDMNALLGDFGIASFYVDSAATSTVSTSTVGLKGTIGYIAPEYAGGGRHASTSGDVYSFGIILLEMMTGKRPTDPMFKDGLDIVSFVNSNFPHQIYNVIDAHLMEECKGFDKSNMAAENAFNQCSVSFLQVALRCAHSSPSERLNMKEIASKMHTIKTSYLSSKATKYASQE